MGKAMREAGFHAPARFLELREMANGIISRGNKMGEGWLLTAEMVELVTTGYENIVCAQPFGCLPNHICGKGMISRIRAIYPNANITPIDYDPSATPVEPGKPHQADDQRGQGTAGGAHRRSGRPGAGAGGWSGIQNRKHPRRALSARAALSRKGSRR